MLESLNSCSEANISWRTWVIMIFMNPCGQGRLTPVITIVLYHWTQFQWFQLVTGTSDCGCFWRKQTKRSGHIRIHMTCFHKESQKGAFFQCAFYADTMVVAIWAVRMPSLRFIATATHPVLDHPPCCPAAGTLWDCVPRYCRFSYDLFWQLQVRALDKKCREF